MIDLDIVRRFVARLTATDQPGMVVSWQTFDDAKKGRDHLARIVHGATVPTVLEELARLNDAGAGVFCMVNAGDGHGRKAENVVAVRALFVDLDGASVQPVLDARPVPHLVVETSPSRFSAFWIVRPCRPHSDRFRAVQAAIARKFSGDPKVVDLPRVMRVPGFLHRKREPFLSRILLDPTRAAYSARDVVDGLDLRPLPEPAPQPAFASRVNLSAGAHGGSFGSYILDQAVARIRAAADGAQHDTLNREAFSVGSLARSAGLLDARAIAQLIDAGRSMTSYDPARPWVKAEIERQVRAAYQDGLKKPREARQ
jgi:hypothetical protein